MIPLPIRLLAIPFVASLSYGVSLYQNDFEADTPGQQPSNLSNISASSGNEVIVVDGTTTQVNPLPGQSMFVHDLGGAASVRADIELTDEGENFNNLRVAFDFQRAFPAVDDTDVRIDFGIGPSGAGLNSSANRPFDLRILNQGEILTKNLDLADPILIGTYDTDNPNTMVIILNSHNENSLDFDYSDIGSGTVATNSYRVFVNGVDLGEWGFFDNLTYYSESNVLGKMAFFQDTSRRGGIVFDNISVETVFDAQTPVINDLFAATASVVAGDSTSITVGASGAGDLSYQWYLGNSGDTNSPINTPSGTTETVEVGPINADTTYWVRVTNADGFTDSSDLTITTHAIRAPFTVTNQSELDALLGTLIAGDTVLIPDGEYIDWRINFYGEGTTENPVRLVAENPGFVTFGGSSTLNIGGNHSEVSGLVFTGDYTGSEDNVIEFRSANGQPAHNSRFTNSAIIDYNPTSGDRTFWINLYGTYNTVDYNYISGLNVSGLMLVAWLDGEPDYHVVANNHFANRAYGGGENGWETIRLGTSTTSLSDASITVENNLFDNCDGEIEIISNKSGKNIYRYNTFFESSGALTLRHGNECLIDSNMFIGNNKSSNGGSGGIRIIGTDHVVINNYFENITDRHDAAISIEAGIPNPPLAGYQAPHNAIIAFNTIVNSSNDEQIISNRDLGDNHTVDGTVYQRSEAAENVTIANNIFYRSVSRTGSLFSGAAQPSTIWEGNIAFNGSIGSQAGVTLTDPMLMLDSSTMIYRPASNSPVIDAAIGDYTALTMLDVDGDARTGTYDVGADEVFATGLTPHTAATTGPTWLGEDRVLPSDGPELWAGFEIGDDDWVDTEGWLGFVNVGVEPWYYSFQLDTFFYMPSRPTTSSNGYWAYFATNGPSSDAGTGSTWAGYSLDDSNWGNADNLFGFFNTNFAPYIYVFGNVEDRGDVDAFIYMQEPAAGFGGAWGYLFRP